jgi:hypothetical protein
MLFFFNNRLLYKRENYKYMLPLATAYFILTLWLMGFVPGRPLKPSPTFASKVRRLLPYSQVVSLGCRGLSGTTTLAYLSVQSGKKKKKVYDIDNRRLGPRPPSGARRKRTRKPERRKSPGIHFIYYKTILFYKWVKIS